MVAWTRVIMIEMSDVNRVKRYFGGSGNGLGGRVEVRETEALRMISKVWVVQPDGW